jgi:hypothetical protein
VPQFVSAMPPATVKICTNCAGEAVYKAPWRTQPPGYHQRSLGSCSDLIASSGGLIIYAAGKIIGRSPYANPAKPSIPLCASPSLAELRPSIVICHRWAPSWCLRPYFIYRLHHATSHVCYLFP